MSTKLYRSPLATVIASVLLALSFGVLLAMSLGAGAAYAADESAPLVAGSIAATETQPDSQADLKPGVQVGVQTSVQTSDQALAADAMQNPVGIPIASAKAAKVKKLTYNGKAQRPAIKLTYKKKTLKKGRDYLLSYEQNVNAGKGLAVVTGIGKYSGTKVISFKIAQAPMSKAKIGKIAAQKYTGAAITPAPKVKFGKKTLAVGADYTVSYSKNVKAGTAKVKVKGIGNYKGSKTVTFKINKPKSAAKSAKRSAASYDDDDDDYYYDDGDTVYITNTGAKYHRGSCRWLYASKIPISRSEAIAEGYTACKVCRP